MIVVSPFAKPGYISHSYTDHASILKFIEANWRLPKLSKISLDNLPNPRRSGNPYIPKNRPAIGNMMDFFDFGQATIAQAPSRLPKLRGGQRTGNALVPVPNALR
jgi:phospholipase C